MSGDQVRSPPGITDHRADNRHLRRFPHGVLTEVSSDHGQSSRRGRNGDLEEGQWPLKNVHETPVTNNDDSVEEKVAQQQEYHHEERSTGHRRRWTISSLTKGFRASLTHEDYQALKEFTHLTEISFGLPKEDAAENEAQDTEDQWLARGGAFFSPSPPRPLSRAPGANSSDASLTSPQRLMTQVFILSNLIFFSILGTLARMGLTALTSYKGAPVSFPVLWSNIVGTFFLGFLTEGSRLLGHPPAKVSISRRRSVEWDKAPSNEGVVIGRPTDDVYQPATAVDEPKLMPVPLYIGLATGFCGSFTTFSGFMKDSFLAFSNSTYGTVDVRTGTAVAAATSSPTGASLNLMAVLAIIIVTVGMILAALKTGAHLGIFLSSLTRKSVPRNYYEILNIAMVMLAGLSWGAAIWLAIDPPESIASRVGNLLYVLAMSPAGTLLRFWLSMKLNSRVVGFPLGTFLVNILGTTVLSGAYVLQRVHAPEGIDAMLSCQVLGAVMDGFCGCLTTVSTWALELSSLMRRQAYVYGLSTLVGGLVITVAVMGTVKWTVGWSQPSC